MEVSKNPSTSVRTYSGSRICRQKFEILIPKNKRTLAKQNQAGSYMWVTVKL